MFQAAVSNLRVEALEARWHLSTTALKVPSVHPIAEPHYNKNRPISYKSSSGAVVPSYAGLSYAYGKSPTTVRSAYGLGTYGSSPITFNGIQGDGAGQTIAIVDAYDYPTAFGDLNAFSSAFGLPTLTSNTSGLSAINSSSGPTFSKISQTGSFASLPATDSAGPYWSTGGGTWEQEASLDIEWAHVMAPRANIVLVEGTTNTTLFTAVNYAKTIPGVDVVSMSFGSTEFNGESSYDSYFTTPSGHQGGAASAGGTLINGGVTFLASTGDTGGVVQFPSASPNVVAVGGTTLNTSGNSYVSETAWGGGGGGISAYSAQPSYQSGTVSAFSTTKRTVPDLSLLADPNTGVPIYDSWDFENPNDSTLTPWIPGAEGGTSLSCPLMAGIVALADQGRAISGLGSLYSNVSGSGTAAGALQNIYSISSGDYHDITSGSNGFSALAGYDLATGRGSPIVGTFIRDVGGLPSTFTATGTVFTDKNGNGTFDSTDTILSGITVYADVNGNGVYDAATDLYTTSNASGVFTLAGVATGIAIREVLPSGYVAVTSTTAGTISGANLAGLTLANFPTTFTASAATTYTLRLDATGSYEQIFVNAATSASPTYQVGLSKLTTLSFAGSAGDDVFNVDTTYGNPMPSGTSVTFAGGGQSSADRVTVTGPSVQTSGTGTNFIGGASNPNVGSVTIGSATLTYSAVEGLGYVGTSGNDAVALTTNALPFAYVGGGGSDTLTASNGAYAPAADLGADGTSLTLTRTGGTTTFATGQHLASLALAGGATAAFTGTGSVLRTSALSIDTGSNSALDLGTAGLVYDYATSSPAAALAALLKLGYAGGAWAGLGVRSSAAAADATRAHAIGYGEASATLGLSGSVTASFLGETVDATTLLARYTYYGDANLTGSVDVSDLGALATNYGASSGQTWATGDFNFDALIDVADLGLLATNYGKSIA